MSQPEIKAEKINSPIQLMAAWFVMLILLSGVLLTTATQIEKPSWAAGYLVISTSILILIVIVAVILMLTKFRPHLQEGREYAEWLKEQNKYSVGLIREEPESKSLGVIQRKLEQLKHEFKDSKETSIISKIEDAILYTVSIINLDGADKILNAMREFNVESKIYNTSTEVRSRAEKHQSIWLGRNVPADIAVPIIKKAVNIWPHLKYIAFPGDQAPESTQWQIFIGGATSTSKERGYLPWSNDEINALEPKEQNAFHADIYAKLP